MDLGAKVKFFIRASFKSAYYLEPLAQNYGVVLHPIDEKGKKQYLRKAAGLTILSILFILLFVYIVHETKMYPLVIIGLIPAYLLIYKNWMYGLYLGLGRNFIRHYKEDKQAYIRRSFWLMILMHIPIFWLFQPWFLQILADVYFKHRSQ